MVVMKDSVMDTKTNNNSTDTNNQTLLLAINNNNHKDMGDSQSRHTTNRHSKGIINRHSSRDISNSHSKCTAPSQILTTPHRRIFMAEVAELGIKGMLVGGSN